MGAPAAAPMDAELFREVMGGFATGVAVVTTTDGGRYHGMTVNSLTAVSLDPILLLVCLARGSRSAAAVASCRAFLVNLLAQDQREVSNTFARRTEDHFADVEVEVTPEGLPLLPGSLGHLVCEVRRVDDGGDHLIVLGEAVRGAVAPGEPLIFYRGRYGRYLPLVRSVRDVGVDWFG